MPSKIAIASVKSVLSRYTGLNSDDRRAFVCALSDIVEEMDDVKLQKVMVDGRLSDGRMVTKNDILLFLEGVKDLIDDYS